MRQFGKQLATILVGTTLAVFVSACGSTDNGLPTGPDFEDK